MSTHRLLISTCLVACAFAQPAFAVEDPLQLVISPTRTATPITKIASSVTVIDEIEIERKNKPTVIELLREVPGVTLANSGGTGQSTRLFMRGTNSNHVLVIIDGVPVNDPSDPATAYDFSNLTTDNIARIEVLRGPQSTIYGSQAIGGVINIFTKQGKGAPSYNAFAEYGRYNSRKEGVGASGEVGRTSYSFTASESHTNGISSFDKRYGGKEKDANTNYNFSGNVVSRLTEYFTAKLNMRYNRSVSEFDSVGSIYAFGLRPDDDAEPNGDSRQINMRAAGELTLLEGRWKQELGVSTVDFNRVGISEYFDSSFAVHFGRQQFLGRRDMLDWIHHFSIIPNHVITAGAEISTDHFKINSPFNGIGEVNADNMAFFADDQYTVGDAFLNVGVREDIHQAFGKQFTWKVAPGYNIQRTGTIIKATYGTGFKAPSLSQLFDPSSGNPALGPERSKGWDAGFEQKLLGDKLTFGSTFFRNNITGLIGFGPAPLFATLNVGKARTEGVESSIKYAPLPNWSLDANHTYTLSQNHSDGSELKRRPKHMFNFDSVYQYSDQGDVGVNVHHSSSSRDFAYDSFVGALTDVKSYTTVNLTTNYRINPRLLVYGRLDNLLDKRYQQVSGYGQPGRGLYVGAKVSY